MNITIAASTGESLTKLSAFDAALFNAGIANYNLLRLSSVIPPETSILHVDATVGHSAKGNWGDKLYVVMAEMRQDIIGGEAWAGIGWVQDKASGKGLFVEHEGYSKEEVESDIHNSLKSLMITRGIDFGEIQMKLSGAVCEKNPVCAMVVAVYAAEGW